MRTALLLYACGGDTRVSGCRWLGISGLMSGVLEQPVAAPADATPSLNAGPLHPASHSERFWPMVLGATGVVYGDIGTSPLYAMKAALEHAKTGGAEAQEVIGIVSLLLWALVFIVTVKYVLFVMRADNRGEGGTLTLMSMAQKALGGARARRVSDRGRRGRPFQR